MGNMKFFWLFGFEWWGSLRPAEMTTAKGVTYAPLFLGLWVKRPTRRAVDVALCTCTTRPTPNTLQIDPACPLHLQSR
jgi:hypothetical protein